FFARLYHSMNNGLTSSSSDGKPRPTTLISSKLRLPKLEQSSASTVKDSKAVLPDTKKSLSLLAVQLLKIRRLFYVNQQTEPSSFVVLPVSFPSHQVASMAWKLSHQ